MTILASRRSMKTNALVLALTILMCLIMNEANGRTPPMDQMESSNVSSSLWPSAKAMFVLGDSSVDCGDNTPFFQLLHQNLSLHPCNGSDAGLLPNLLATKMGLPYVMPFYSQNGSVQELVRGVNFGSALATIMYSSSPSHQSLSQQLRQVSETIQLLQLELGQEIANEFIRSSLFYLSFGKDDYVSYFLHNSNRSSFRNNYQKFTYILIHEMINAMRNLYGANIRNIVCVGVLPLGCAPRILYWSNSTTGEINGCEDNLNKMVLEYNIRLKEKLVDLNAELPEANIIFCDVYHAIMEFIIHPKDYGFEDVRNACCGMGSYGAMSSCLTTDMACQKSSANVWWDFYNPTQSVNSLLAESAWSGRPLSAICRPLTVQQLTPSST